MSGRPIGSSKIVVTLLSVAMALPGLLLAACGPKIPPPTLTSAWIRVEAGLAPEHAEVRVPRGGEVSIGTGPFNFVATFDAMPVDAWYTSGITTEGPNPIFKGHPDGQANPPAIQISYGPGEPGEKMTIRLSAINGETGQKYYSLVVRRLAAPTPTVSVLENNVWKEWQGEAVQVRPLSLRLAFDLDMEKASVEAALPRVPYDYEWIDQTTMQIEIGDDPPAVIDLHLGNAHDLSGLLVGDEPGSISIYTRGPAQIYSYDPSGGKERSLWTTVPNIVRAQLSPNGKKMLIGFYRNQEGAQASFLVDLPSGNGWREEWADARWVDDTNVATLAGPTLKVSGLDGAVSSEKNLGASWKRPSWQTVLLSPDGTKLAGHAMEGLVVYDITSRGEAADWIFAGVGSDSTYMRPLLAWSPESDRILAAQPPSGAGFEVAVADVGTRTSALVANLDRGSWTGDLAWSPAGNLWLVGRAVLEAAPPYEPKAVDVPAKLLGNGYAEFSPDGRFLALGSPREWGPLAIYDITTGQVAELGEAVPCGWDTFGVFYFIRWPDRQYAFDCDAHDPYAEYMSGE